MADGERSSTERLKFFAEAPTGVGGESATRGRRQADIDRRPSACRFKPMRHYNFFAILLALTINGAAVAQRGNLGAKEADAILSPTFQACFGPNAPLNAESY